MSSADFSQKLDFSKNYFSSIIRVSKSLNPYQDRRNIGPDLGPNCLQFALSSADFFSKLTFSKNSFRSIIRVSNRLDPDQDRRSVGPDLGPICLLRLSADDKSCS